MPVENDGADIVQTAIGAGFVALCDPEGWGRRGITNVFSGS